MIATYTLDSCGLDRHGATRALYGNPQTSPFFVWGAQPGALLHLGDGHALQGDGETTQWALETSLDVEFSVQVLPPAPLATPRIESAEAITTLGQAGSLDEAVRLATAGMVQWLAQAYGLDDRESSLVIGTVAELRIATLAGRNAGVALKLPKGALGMLRPTGR